MWLLTIAVAAFLVYFVSICVRIIDAGSREELHSADAIVVFGAAEYSGRPSPVYRARLDHAFDLYPAEAGSRGYHDGRGGRRSQLQRGWSRSRLPDAPRDS